MPVVALGALDLGVDMIAMCAMLLILAALLITNIVSEVTHHLPQIFPLTLLNNVADWVGSVLSSLASWLWDHCNPFRVILDWGNWIWVHVFIAIPAAIGAAISAINRVITVTIPGYINWMVSAAYNIVNAAMAGITAWVWSLVGLIQSWIWAAEAEYKALFAAAESFAAGIVQQVYRDVAAAFTAAYAFTTAMVNGAINTLEQDIHNALEWLLGVIGAAVGAVAADLDLLRQWLMSQVLPSILAIGATVAALAIDWGNWRAKCGDPMCNGFSDLLNLVTGLEAVLDAELLFQLVQDFRNDPASVTAEAKAALVDPINAIADTLGIKTAA